MHRNIRALSHRDIHKYVLCMMCVLHMYTESNRTACGQLNWWWFGFKWRDICGWLGSFVDGVCSLKSDTYFHIFIHSCCCFSVSIDDALGVYDAIR